MVAAKTRWKPSMMRWYRFPFWRGRGIDSYDGLRFDRQHTPGRHRIQSLAGLLAQRVETPPSAPRRHESSTGSLVPVSNRLKFRKMNSLSRFDRIIAVARSARSGWAGPGTATMLVFSLLATA